MPMTRGRLNATLPTTHFQDDNIFEGIEAFNVPETGNSFVWSGHEKKHFLFQVVKAFAEALSETTDLDASSLFHYQKLSKRKLSM